jgi:hypothetical protein
VEWVKALWCVYASRSIVCGGPTHNHHTKNGGRGRKGDAATIVPLCENHHVMLHSEGARSMAQRYPDVNLDAAAAETERKWIAYSAGRKSA